MTSSGPEQATGGPPGRRTRGPVLGRLALADRAVIAGTLLYLLCALVPWYRVAAFDLGRGYSFPGASVNGFDSGLVVLAFVLLLLATAWAVLPAVADVPVRFPRSLVTVGLATAAFLLTLIEWLSDLDIGFSLMGLLALLAAVTVLTGAVLRLLPELRRTAPPAAESAPPDPSAPRAGAEVPPEAPASDDPEPPDDSPYRGPPPTLPPAGAAGDAAR
ncbi:hypothetical protein [Modestobacter altitudinis]|uniref:hypothetical protein n=1 Tax=Modestobacter altitudinis TaxID=2213158 RepID=UPI00110D01EF|nr:hypothetical protein [Modestobacter altitudinis]